MPSQSARALSVWCKPSCIMQEGIESSIIYSCIEQGRFFIYNSYLTFFSLDIALYSEGDIP